MERTTLCPASDEQLPSDTQCFINELHQRYEAVNAKLLQLQKRALIRQHRAQLVQLPFGKVEPMSQSQHNEATKNLLLMTEIQQMQESQLVLRERLALFERTMFRQPVVGSDTLPQATAFPPQLHSQTSPLSGLSPQKNSAPAHSTSDALRNSLSYAHQALPSPKGRRGLVPKKRMGLMISPSAPPAKRHATDLKSATAEKIESAQHQTVPCKARSPVPMAAASDRGKLSTLQVHIRESLEFFVNTGDDLSSSPMRSHKKIIQPYQVGIRCKYCAHIPLGNRRKAAVSYPKTLLAVYRASQNIASTHLLDDAEEGCPFVPLAVRNELEIQRPQRDASNVGVSYWVETCRAVGIEESQGALWFTNRNETAKTKEPNHSLSSQGE